MQNIIFLYLLFFSSLGLAQNPRVDMSFEQLLRLPNVHVDMPHINMRGVQVPMHKVCVDGDSLRPFDPFVQRCPGQPAEARCQKPERVYLSTPMTYAYSYCGEYEDGVAGRVCVREISGYRQVALEYYVDVSQLIFDQMVVQFKKRLEIEACP